MPTALDYSAGRPTGAAVKAAQHAGVVRYVGTPGRTKNVTKAEYQDMDRNGIGVALVYENHAGDAAGGHPAGQAAAYAARKDADSIGFPVTRPIYFAVDSDQVTAGQFAAAMAYLDGAASILGRDLVGVYGEYDVIEMAVGNHARFGWQTAAWSKNKRSAKAALFQQIGTVVVGGIASDVNTILASDWGQHNAQEDDMWTEADFNTPLFTDNAGTPQVRTVRFRDVMGELRDRSAATAKALSDLAIAVAKGNGITADQLAAKLLPALTTALAAEVQKVDAISDEDAQQIAAAVTARAGALLGGAA